MNQGENGSLMTGDAVSEGVSIEGSDDVTGTNALSQSFAVADLEVARQLGLSGGAGGMNVNVHVENAVGGAINGVRIEIVSDGDPDRGLQDVARLAALFVEPRDELFAPTSGVSFGQLRERLLTRVSRVAVIVGETGTGRSIAARALLAQVSSAWDVECARLSLGGACEFPSRRLATKQRRVLLLDLPADEEDAVVSSQFGADLAAAIATLRENDTYLIVVTTPKQWTRISHGAPESVAWYSRSADLLKITRSRLAEYLTSDEVDCWVGDSRIGDLLDGQRPRDAVDIAGLIRAAHFAPPGALDDVEFGGEGAAPAALQASEAEFNHRVMSVVNARSNWHAHLLRWHIEPGRTALERNFMLVVAALPEGTHVSAAYAQAVRLSKRFDESLREDRGQQGPGAIAMTQFINARLAEDLTVRFTRPGWADAVLRYFWTDRPDLVQDFVKWLADVRMQVKSPRRQELAQQVGERLIRLASDRRDMMPLTALFKAWSADRELCEVAAKLCTERVAGSSALESVFHGELLRWSKSEDPLLRRLVVDVCAAGYGAAFPGKALVRLNHAAAAADPDLDTVITAALLQIWELPSMRGTLFKRLCAWTRSRDARAAKARRTFASLAALTVPDGVKPQLLEPSADGERFEEEDLVQGWRSVLQHDEDWVLDPVATWLDAAIDNPDTRAWVFRILHTAAAGTRDRSEGPRAFTNLVLLAWRWERRWRASAGHAQAARLRQELEDSVFADVVVTRIDHDAEPASLENGSGEVA